MDGVVVTGAGIVSPIALGIHAFWNALISGRHGFKAFPHAADLPGNDYWAAVPDAYLTPTNLPPEFLRNADRFTQYAVIAAAQAFSMAGLELPPAKTAVLMGNTMGVYLCLRKRRCSAPQIHATSAHTDRERCPNDLWVFRLRV